MMRAFLTSAFLSLLLPVAQAQEEDHAHHQMQAPVSTEEKDHAHHPMHEPATAEDDAGEHTQHAAPRTPIPVLTDADRAAAFPPEVNHPVHDEQMHYFFLFDRLEATDTDEGNGTAWEAQGWFGGDVNRLWLRSEGERVDGATESADIELLYGRSVSAWWDVVGGIRHDVAPGDSQTFAAFGVQGLSPYKFEIEATAYFGEGGQTAASLEVEYDTLLTRRLILQWRAEATFYGKDDVARGIAGGFNTLEAGARLRYEIRREFAPYVGIEWERHHGDAAEWRRDAGEDVKETRIVAGVRVWF